VEALLEMAGLFSMATKRYQCGHHLQLVLKLLGAIFADFGLCKPRISGIWDDEF
jgi:hypothetical protein